MTDASLLQHRISYNCKSFMKQGAVASILKPFGVGAKFCDQISGFN